MSDRATLREWEQALQLAARLGSAPAEAVEAGLAALREQKGPYSVSLVAYTVDLPEEVVQELLTQVRALAGAQAAQETRTDARTLDGVPPVLGGLKVGEKLGEGGMGAVFRAHDPALGRDVALKVLSPRLALDEEALPRFLREGRALAKVNDPHVVACYRVGQAQGLQFIVLELLRGGDADGLAREHGGRLPERRALEIARDAAAGLIALEQAGLVHRDVKPKNIFLTEEGRAKLGDLGLARGGQNDRVTLSGYAIGTPTFMSPEQLGAASDLDVRTDVYAVGATLYQLLTGQPPPMASPRPANPRDVVPELSGPTVALVRRCLEFDRERRFSSARTLHDAIAGALKRLDAPTAPRAGRSRRTAVAAAPDRRPVLAVGAGAVVLGVALALWSGTARRPQTPDSPLASAATAFSTPTPTPSAEETLPPPPPLPTRSPTAEPTTEPTAEPTTAPTQEPEPGPTADPEPVPSPEVTASSPPPSPTPTPAPTPKPNPTRSLTPTPTPKPKRTRSPTPKPKPTRSPTPKPTPKPTGALAFDVGGDAGTLTRRADGTYVSNPGAGGWSRAGLFDRAERRLPLRVTWTCQARATRDSTSGNFEHHGFRGGGAGFFYELGLRATNDRIAAAQNLRRGAWWVSLQVQTNGRVLGMVRTLNANKPPDQDLVVGRTPGVDVLGHFAFRANAKPFDVRVDFTRRGWSLTVRRGRKTLARAKAPWSRGRAPITTELNGPVYLWGHLGNWSNGQGAGTLSTRLR